MDSTDKFINNRAPKLILLIFICLFAVSALCSWVVSEKCAESIVSEQIDAMLAVSGGGKFTGIPSEDFIIKGEEIYSQAGVHADMAPQLMSSFSSVRNRIFCIILVFSGAICTLGAVFAIRQTFRIYNDLEALRLECIKIAEDADCTAQMYGEDFGSVRRISEAVYLIASRMNYLNFTLGKEKRFLKEFLTDFSHQLKTSLTVIRLNSDMLAELDNLTEKKKQQLSEEIFAHLEGMEALILSALKLAKLNADAIEYSMNETNLYETCCEAVSRITPLLRNKSITGSVSGNSSVSMPHDRMWLCEAVENIIKNSADHSECSSVSVEISCNPTIITIAVSDNGKGIPQNEIPQLFERFGKKSRDISMSSSGIGMSIAKNIVSAHNGEILIYSEPGKGTRFEINFIK